MPKRDGSPTVAEKRAAGTNNASVNKAAKAAGTFTGNVGKAPAPTPTPTPSPSPSPTPSPTPSPSPSPTPSPTPSPSPSPSSSSGGGGNVNRVGSVAYNRAQAKERGQTMRQYKAKGKNNNPAPKPTTPTPTPTPTPTVTPTARLSSEGLYQDRYSVGKNGEDDLGDTYLSQGALGNINDYFKISGNTQEEVRESWNNADFDKSYESWSHTGRSDGGGHGGYAGDVLKMIDQNNFKVTDEQYNRLVNDAKNYNWDSKMSSDGTQAGKSHADFNASGTYDARIGGTMESQGNMNDVTANKYGDWTNEEYYSGASVDARNTRKKQANDAYDANSIRKGGEAGTHEYEQYKPEGFKYDPYNPQGTNQYGDPSGTAYDGGSPTFNESTGQHEYYTGADGTVSNGPQGAGQSETNKNQANYNNTYAKFNYQPNTSQYGTRQFDFKSGNNGKMMNLNFDFDPNRFNQGQ